jgi:hypothetical protein
MPERSRNALDLTATLDRMTGVTGFQPKRRLALRQDHVSAAKINTRLKERIVASLGRSLGL